VSKISFTAVGFGRILTLVFRLKMEPGLEAEMVSAAGRSLGVRRVVERQEEGCGAVEQWAELRRLRFVAGVSIRELGRRTGPGRNTIRRALRAEAPPAYVRRPGASKLDGFREEIQRLLGEDPRLRGIRIFELITEPGFDRGKTLVYDYVAELRPLYAPPPRAFNGRVTAAARSCSSTSGSRPARSRSAMARPGAAGSWSLRWLTRGRAPGR
jgi:hypothetical protein